MKALAQLMQSVSHAKCVKQHAAFTILDQKAYCYQERYLHGRVSLKKRKPKFSGTLLNN